MSVKSNMALYPNLEPPTINSPPDEIIGPDGKITIDYLSVDSETPFTRKQKFAVFSVVGPNAAQKTNVWGIKIRGAVPDEATATSLANYLKRTDPYLDMYTAPIGVFVPLQVSEDDIASGKLDVQYQITELNDLMKEHRQARDEANDHFEQRRQELREKIRKDNIELNVKVPDDGLEVLVKIKEFVDKEIALKKELMEVTKNIEQLDNFFTVSYDDETKAACEKAFLLLDSSKQLEAIDSLQKSKVE